MRKEIQSYGKSSVSPFDQIKRTSESGAEFWSARDLMPLLGYDKWERFQGAIERAVVTAANQGSPEAISRLREMVPQGGAERIDYRLSRFGAYLVAMNGDPRKPEVAAAQAYFAIRTREAETRPAVPAIPQNYAEALRAAAGEYERAELEAARANQAEKAIERQAPLVAKAQAHSDSQDTKGRQLFAREVQMWGLRNGHRIIQADVYRLLTRKGMLIGGQRSDTGHITAKAQMAGWGFTTKGVDEKTGRAWATAKITASGQDIAWKWVHEALKEFGPSLNKEEAA